MQMASAARASPTCRRRDALRGCPKPQRRTSHLFPVHVLLATLAPPTLAHRPGRSKGNLLAIRLALWFRPAHERRTDLQPEHGPGLLDLPQRPAAGVQVSGLVRAAGRRSEARRRLALRSGDRAAEGERDVRHVHPPVAGSREVRPVRAARDRASRRKGRLCGVRGEGPAAVQVAHV